MGRISGRAGRNWQQIQAFQRGPKDPSGLPIIALGAKGDLSVHITVETMNRNVHARYASVFSPSRCVAEADILGK